MIDMIMILLMICLMNINAVIITPSCKIDKFGMSSDKIAQGECYQVPRFEELNDLEPQLLTHLLIRCNSSNNNTTTISSTKDIELHVLKVIQYLPKLIFLFISNCSQIITIPSDTFHNSYRLNNVHLDRLPIKTLPANLFPNSPNLTELSLSHLSMLKSIDPFLLTPSANPIINSIHLNQLNLSSNQIQPFLLVNYKSIKTITITNSLRKSLSFKQNYFQDFQLKQLSLVGNRFYDNNIDFLINLNSTSIILEHNQLTTNRFPIGYLNQSPRKLVLSNNNLNGLFPDLTSKKSIQTKSYLETLLLDHNEINELHQLFGDYFIYLKLLDLRFNRIKKLPSSLGRIDWQDGGILFIGGANRLFCGCELNWLFDNDTRGRKRWVAFEGVDKKLVCDSYTYWNKLESRYEEGRNGKRRGIMVKNRGPISCIGPTVEIQVIKNRRVSARIKQNGTQIELYPCEYIQLRCVSRGDPLPFTQIYTNIQNHNRYSKQFVSSSSPTWWWSLWYQLFNFTTPVNSQISMTTPTVTLYPTHIHHATPTLIITYTQLQDRSTNIFQCSAHNYINNTRPITLFINKRNGSRNYYNYHMVYNTYRCNANKSTYILLINFLWIFLIFYIL